MSQDRAIAAELMRAHPFASLISTDDDGLPYVTHLPLVLDDRGEGGFALLGHCAKPNPHWRYLQARPQAVVSFPGAACLHVALGLSRTWRACRPGTTWRCTARSQARLIETPAEKDALLKRLIGEHEPAYAQQWRDLGEEFQHKMLDGIVGFELQVTALQCKLKLNQHRREVACRDVRALQRGHAGRTGAGRLDGAARHGDRRGADGGSLRCARSD